jgi:nitroreductase
MNMETEKTILERRSVREYEDKKVPEDIVAKLLKSGAMAPSTMDKQPCRFIVITNQDKIKELSKKVKEKLSGVSILSKFFEARKSLEDPIFYSAPLLILIVAEKNDWAPINCSLAAQNMMLRAYDMGLGSCFIGFLRYLKDDTETIRSLGVEDNQEIFCPLIFGYPKELPEQKIREAKVQNKIV